MSKRTQSEFALPPAKRAPTYEMLEYKIKKLEAEKAELKAEKMVLQSQLNDALDEQHNKEEEQRTEMQKWNEMWKKGEVVLADASTYFESYTTLESAKAKRDVPEHTEELMWRRDGKWYIEDVDSYVSWHEVKSGDLLYNPTEEQKEEIYKKTGKDELDLNIEFDGPDTDQFAHCRVCNEYGEIDGNAICDCMRCGRFWCLYHWEQKGGDHEYCKKCRAKSDVDRWNL